MIESNEILLLKELGKFIGIEGLTFNPEGFCLLQLQDRFSFIIKNDTVEQRLIIIAEIETPSQVSEKCFYAMLAFNFGRIATPGSWIALDQNTKILFLVDEFSLVTIEIKKFQKRLIQFFKHYLTFQNIFVAENGSILLKEEEDNDDAFYHLESLA